MGREVFRFGLEDFGDVLNSVLSPSSAIKTPEFLQGRDEQVREVREALAMKGRHVFLHGFRGVGKTSLAYTTANIIQSSDGKPIYVQCSPEGTMTGLIYDILKQAMPSDPTQIKRMVEKKVGLNATLGKFGVSAGMRQSIESGNIPRPETVNDAVELICFAAARHSQRPVVIVDEFDHMNRDEHVQVDLFIKKLAEVDDLPLKLIMCGVGETLESLFAAHLSTYRYFHTIKVDRLRPEPLRAIIFKACATLGVSMDDTTAWRITRVSDGFPHFVHLMCEKIFWAMYNDENDTWMKDGNVALQHYRKGAHNAVSAANEELRKGYELAVRKYAKNAEAILWAAADGHELQRKVVDMHKSYQRSILSPTISLWNTIRAQMRAFLPVR